MIHTNDCEIIARHSVEQTSSMCTSDCIICTPTVKCPKSFVSAQEEIKLLKLHAIPILHDIEFSTEIISSAFLPVSACLTDFFVIHFSIDHQLKKVHIILAEI